jgi:pimeloyl-ACP methyl ester carboxylesterase
MSTILANQIRCYYEEHGQGEPLVFIHGLGSSTRDWEYQVPEFSKSFRVITYDMRGHGQSDKPAGPYTIPMLASDLAGLLRALQIPSAHVVGISLGGAIAFQFALDCPEMAKTLTIVNSGPSLGGTLEQARQEIERRVGVVQQLGMRAMGEALSSNLYPKPEQAALRETFIERWAQNDPQAYIEATRSMLGWNVEDQLGEIQCPTLILTADQDYSPVALKESYAKSIPNAQLVVIPDSHHATPIEQPEKFNAALAEFLSRYS